MIVFETGLVFTSKYDKPAHKTEYIVFNLEQRGDMVFIWFLWRRYNNLTDYETNCAPEQQMQSFFKSGEYTLKKIPQNASQQ